MRVGRQRRALAACGVVGAGALLLWAARPAAQAPARQPYYEALGAELAAHAPARPLILIDLDRLDANLDAVRGHVAPPLRLRLVTKSLPSLELLRYALERTGARGLMAFHAPFLRDLLAATGPEVDVLLGKPVPAGAAREFYDAFAEPAATAAASERIQWLVHDAALLDDYLALARDRDLVLRIAVEIDVGLHRGGARDTEELRPLLEALGAAAGRVRFTGFMGYDGHVAHAPGFLRWPWEPRPAPVQRAFAGMLARYRDFVGFARREFPTLVGEDPTWNGGGSRTYTLYGPGGVVNDLALGGGLLMPATYDGFTLAGHQPAIFIATPVLKRIEAARLPFLESLTSVWRWWNPNRAVAFYVNGGGWAADVVHPTGLLRNEWVDDPPNENLLPTLSLLNGSRRQGLAVGDWVVYRPRQGDALFQFEEIHLLRGGRLAGTWRPFPRRF
ncbi:MAG: alanine racemase [Myxococcota bacterium]|nr:alanine racemase [Myxococcota bacterium]